MVDRFNSNKLANFCIQFYEKLMKETISDHTLVKLFKMFISFEKNEDCNNNFFFIFVNDNHLFLVDKDRDEVNIYNNEMINLPDVHVQYILLCKLVHNPSQNLLKAFSDFILSLEKKKITYSLVEEPIVCNGDVEVVRAVSVDVGFKS